MSLLGPSSELLLQFSVADLDQGGATVGAAVGHLADEQVLEQFLQFGGMERIVRLYRVATHGGGDHVLPEPHLRSLTAGTTEFLDHLVNWDFVASNMG